MFDEYDIMNMVAFFMYLTAGLIMQTSRMWLKKQWSCWPAQELSIFAHLLNIFVPIFQTGPNPKA